MFLKIFLDIPRIHLDYLQIILTSLFVCQSVSWLTLLLILGHNREIFFLDKISFRIFLGDIPWMLLHYFKIILNLMFVCQSVSLLTSLPKLDKYRENFSSRRHIFFKNFLVTFLGYWFTSFYSAWLSLLIDF